ncbi:MAG: hypothetical protein KC503_06945 [Myxococcales bacterium]|nr:hypothetical protein [Myxococcales bacterium]
MMAARALALLLLTSAAGCQQIATFFGGDVGSTPSGDTGVDAARDARGDAPADARIDGDVDSGLDGAPTDARSDVVGPDGLQPTLDAVSDAPPVLTCPGGAFTVSSFSAPVEVDAMDMAIDPSGAPHVFYLTSTGTIEHRVGQITITGGGFKRVNESLALPSHTKLRAAINDKGRIFLAVATDKAASLRSRISGSWSSTTILDASMSRTVHALDVTALGTAAYGVVAYSSGAAATPSDHKRFQDVGSFYAREHLAPGSERWLSALVEARNGVVAFGRQMLLSNGLGGTFELNSDSSYVNATAYLSSSDTSGVPYAIGMATSVVHVLRVLPGVLQHAQAPVGSAGGSLTYSAVGGFSGLQDATTIAATVDARDRLHFAYRDTNSQQLALRTLTAAWSNAISVMGAGSAGRVVLAAADGLLHVAYAESTAVRYTCLVLPP